MYKIIIRSMGIVSERNFTDVERYDRALDIYSHSIAVATITIDGDTATVTYYDWE